jgi:phage baseplate assembly protein W
VAVIKRAQYKSPNDIKSVYYADINAQFQIHPNTRDLSVVDNEDAVKGSIRNILLTRRGERFFNPSFGSDIHRILFENASTAADNDLRTFITTALENFEPRARLLNLDVTSYPDDNGYVITIVFSVINRTEPVTLNILLDRIR